MIRNTRAGAAITFIGLAVLFVSGWRMSEVVESLDGVWDLECPPTHATRDRIHELLRSGAHNHIREKLYKADVDLEKAIRSGLPTDYERANASITSVRNAARGNIAVADKRAFVFRVFALVLGCFGFSLCLHRPSPKERLITALAAFHNASDAMLVVNSEGKIVWADNRAHILIQPDLVGKDLSLVVLGAGLSLSEIRLLNRAVQYNESSVVELQFATKRCPYCGFIRELGSRVSHTDIACKGCGKEYSDRGFHQWHSVRVPINGELHTLFLVRNVTGISMREATQRVIDSTTACVVASDCVVEDVTSLSEAIEIATGFYKATREARWVKRELSSLRMRALKLFNEEGIAISLADLQEELGSLLEASNGLKEAAGALTTRTLGME